LTSNIPQTLIHHHPTNTCSSLAPPQQNKTGDKPRQDLVAAPSADGRPRHRVGLDEVLVPREQTLPGPRPGKQMAVMGGRHEGLRCVVKELLPKVEGRSDRALVRLHPSHEEVEVRCSELGELGDGSGGKGKQQQAAEDERPSSRQQGGGGGSERRLSSRGPDGKGKGEGDRSRDRGGGSKRYRGSSRERLNGAGNGDAKRHRGSKECEGGSDRHHHHHHRDSKHTSKHSSKHSHHRHDPSSSSSSEEDASPTPPPARATWLFPSIRVRLLDKRMAGGRFYLKKGVVVDVHPGALADVTIEETRQVVQLPEAQLETVVPKEAGKPVQVVAGEWRGRRGRLLQVSKSSGVAAVQLSGDMAIVRLSLDDVAEYMGAVEEDDD